MTMTQKLKNISNEELRISFVTILIYSIERHFKIFIIELKCDLSIETLPNWNYL